MLEAGITRATEAIEQIDAKIVAKFLYTAQKKGVEVTKEHKNMVDADPELRALMLPTGNGDWDKGRNEFELVLPAESSKPEKGTD